jgi:tetratricopeptide (TPR) repeat protein
MKKTFGLVHILLLVLLGALILAPRWIEGGMYLNSANRFEAAGDNAEAAQAYASAAQRLQWRPSLWEKAGFNALQAGEIENAITSLNRASDQHAISKEGWFSLGIAYQKQGELALAVKAWEQALPLAEAYGSLAQAERTLGNPSKAIEDWRAVIAQEPDNAPAHYALGLLLMATAPEEALPELMQAAQLDPDLDATVQGLRMALNTSFVSNDQATHFLAAGQALSALGEWDLAAVAFQNAIAVRSDYAEAWAWLGEAHQHLVGQDGGPDLEKALAFAPGSALAQGLYGLYLQRQGKTEAALTAFQNAARLEPDNPGWQIALGSASELGGDLVAAYGYYLQAVKLAPGDASTWRALAAFSVNYNVDVAATGLPAAKKLVDLAPQDWQSYDLAGQAETLLEDYTAAETDLKKASQLSPGQAAPALHLGMVYLQSGRRNSAIYYLSLAQTLEPDGPIGSQAGRLLEQYFP